MSKQSLKLPALALSACSIPVMLAFAGTGTRSTSVQAPSVATEDVSFANDQSCFNPDSLVSTVPVSDSRDLLSTNDYNPASWMCMSPDGDHFWVANREDASIATYRFVDLNTRTEQLSYELVATLDEIGSQSLSSNGVSAQSDDWVDLQLSEDGQWLYQLFEQSGTMAVYEVEGHKLELVETLTA